MMEILITLRIIFNFMLYTYNNLITLYLTIIIIPRHQNIIDFNYFINLPTDEQIIITQSLDILCNGFINLNINY